MNIIIKHQEAPWLIEIKIKLSLILLFDLFLLIFHLLLRQIKW